MGWLDPAWGYRKAHYVEPAAGAGTDYQVRVVVHFGAGADGGEDVYLDSKGKTDFGDLRLTDNTGVTPLSYWIEKKVDSDYAIVWVKVSDDLSVYNKRIYVYYGNVAATSAANGDGTFIFFDDFETNLAKWSAVGQLEGPWSDLTPQHKIVRTADGTLHVITSSVFNTGSGNSYIKHSISRDGGVTWATVNVATTTPGVGDFPSIAVDASDNLYMARGYSAGGNNGRIYFRKALVDKTDPGLWIWAWQTEVTVAAITDGLVPDIVVDANGYIHIVYTRGLANKSVWARSLNGGTTWTLEDITLPTGANQGYMPASIDKDSLGNLYLGLGPLFVTARKFYVEKITYLGGTSWSQGTPTQVSSQNASYGQLVVLPDDRICVLYGVDTVQTIVFRKSTNPRDETAWDAEVLVADGIAAVNRDFTFAYTDSSNFKVVYLSDDWHSDLDLVLTTSSDGGATWGAATQLTDYGVPKRAPNSLRQTVGGNILLIYREYATWEQKYGNILFLTDAPVSVQVYGSSPTFSADHAYSGNRSVKFLPAMSTALQKLVGPTSNRAVHVHLYDQVSPSTEYTVFSFDAGEAEVSYLGIVTDGANYEYMLGGATYDSGVVRTVGWHEFVARMSPGLKEFLIDGNLMPVTGAENYGAIIILIGAATSAVNSYWDTVFETKFVSPEPAHGLWGAEEASPGGTIYVAEDVVPTFASGAHLTEETVFTLPEQAHLVEMPILELLLSPHTPAFLAEEIILALLTQRLRLAEDSLLELLLSPHTPAFLVEDVVLALLAQRRFKVVHEFGAEGGVGGISRSRIGARS
jgi:hypothetical protein